MRNYNFLWIFFLTLQKYYWAPKWPIFSRRILVENEPDYYSGKFFCQTTECMRSGYFLQKLLKLLDQVRTREQILNVSRVKLSRYNVEYSVDETEWSSFHFFQHYVAVSKFSFLV